MERKNITNSRPTIAVIGLGYVGLPVLLAFSEHFTTVGFDNDARVITKIATSHPHLKLTSDEDGIEGMAVFIVLVPTPTHADNTPDLSYLENACRSIGRQMPPGATVIFESTVYPGTTEDICIPLLEETSGLVWKKDFWVAYSPERINPGDSKHGFSDVIKVVAGDTLDTAERVQKLYNKVVQAGTYLAPTIRVAETAKILENVQRDVNIALINEFALLMQELNIDTSAVINAAATKWNFMKFTPGLPGGHCIGVDSQYLLYKAAQIGFDPKIIAMSRRVNENIVHYIVEQSLKRVQHASLSRIVSIYGLSFKENMDDIRNSASLALVEQFLERGCEVYVNDPLVNAPIAQAKGIKLTPRDEMPIAHHIVISVAHDEYKSWPLEYFVSRLAVDGLITDVKSLLDKSQCESYKVSLWQL